MSSELIDTAPKRRFRLRRVVSPGEVLAILLVIVTLGINVGVHHTLDLRILTESVSTYGTLFQGHVQQFFKLAGCAAAIGVAWQLLRLLTGRPLLARRSLRSSQVLPAIRGLAVYFLCGTAFSNVHGFVHQLSPTDRDGWLIAADRTLFLGHDPIKLLEPLVNPIAVNVFVQVYISFVVVAWVAMIVLLYQGKLRAFRDMMVSLLLTIWIGYIGYLLVPAIGPEYTLHDTYVRPILNVSQMLQNGIENLPRDCFPSLHTAVSLTVLLLFWRHNTSRVLRLIFTIWVAGIIFSTVYLRIHYATDVLAGAALALLAAYLGPKLSAWWHAGAKSSRPRSRIRVKPVYGPGGAAGQPAP